MTDLRSEIRLEMEVPFARGTKWGTAVIGAYFLVLVPIYYAHPVGWKEQVSLVAVLGAGIGLLAIAWALRRPPLVPGRSERLAVLAISAILVQILVNLLLLRAWAYTADLMILVVALAFIARRSRDYYPLLAAAAVTWGVAAGMAAPQPGLARWTVNMFSATLASLVIHFHLRRMWAFQEELILKDRQLMEEKDQLVERLEVALENVKTLEGLIPICSHCRKVRNDEGFWEKVETFVGSRTSARFSHGICPECLPVVRAEVEKFKADSGPTRNLRN